jgi:hypothetical protein
MNVKTRKIFFYIAIIGWVFGLIAHLLSIAGHTYSLFWILHLGIFVVWTPAVLYLSKEVKQTDGITGLYNFIRSVSPPKWLIIIAALGFVYAIINFMLYMAGFYPTSDNDPDVVRGFSGHWMAFFSLAALILYPFGHKKDDNNAEVYTKSYK